MSKSTNVVEDIKVSAIKTIREALLLGSSMDAKKGEIYETVAKMIFKSFPYTLTQNADGKWSMTFNDKSFELQAYLITQFPVWPISTATDEKGKKQTIVKSWNDTQDMKKAGKLSDEQVKAFDAINRYKSWFSGYKLSILRERANLEFESKVEAIKMEELKKLPKAQQKDEAIINKIVSHAQKTVRAEQTTSNPRLFDGKGNVKGTTIDKLTEEQREAVEVKLAQTDPDSVIAALAKAGKPVVLAKSIDEMSTAQLLSRISERIEKGEFKQVSEAKKHLEALVKLMGEASNVTPETSAPRKRAPRKVANA